MTNRTASQLASNPLARCLVDRYGVTACAADPIAIEWACSHLLASLTADAVRAALRQVNKIRRSLGKIDWLPDFHHPLFERAGAK